MNDIYSHFHSRPRGGSRWVELSVEFFVEYFFVDWRTVEYMCENKKEKSKQLIFCQMTTNVHRTSRM